MRMGGVPCYSNTCADNNYTVFTPGPSIYYSGNTSYYSSDSLTHTSVQAYARASSTDPTSGVTSTVDSTSSVSVTEGHIAKALSTDTSNNASGTGYGDGQFWEYITFNDPNRPYNYQETLTATLNLTSDLSSVGDGSANVSAHFNSSFQYCDLYGSLYLCQTIPLFTLLTSGSFSSTDTSPTLPAVQTQTFQWGNEVPFLVYGDMSGNVSASSGNGGEASWNMIASNSGHFSITSDNPDVTLTTNSGCSITNGYGCDPVPQSSVPEPPTLLLIVPGLVARLTRRAKTRPS